MSHRAGLRLPPLPARATLLRALAMLPLLLLLGSQFVVALHHHADGSAPDSCPVCVHATTPAVRAGDAPAAPVPGLRPERPAARGADAPALLTARIHASRGPPRA